MRPWWVGPDAVVVVFVVFVVTPLIRPAPSLQARKAVVLLLWGGRPFSWLVHVLTTVAILGLVLMLAIFVPDIRNVFGVVGGWRIWFISKTERTDPGGSKLPFAPQGRRHPASCCLFFPASST